MRLPRCPFTAARLTLLSASAFVLALTCSPANGQGFKPDCKLPFAAGEGHDLDSAGRGCPIAGAKGGSPEQQAQNEAKNNFCAAGNPIPISLATFKDLQTRIDRMKLKYGRINNKEVLPRDRTILRRVLRNEAAVTLGEGRLVSFVAFIIDARHSNVAARKNKTTGKIERDSFGRIKGGESVNCGIAGCEYNDIHVDLNEKKGQSDCANVSAEISPHFRPKLWDQVDSPGYLKFFRDHPVRIRGQLFFDASHKPCVGNNGSPPRRASSWEIHPVYAIDVCKKTSITGCKIADESVWEPLDSSPLATMNVTPGQNCKVPIN